MKDNLWLLIPIITALIVIAAIAFLYFQPQMDATAGIPNPPQGKTFHYADYLGKWISGKTAIKQLLPDQGGSVIEIQDISNQFVKGTLTKISKNGTKKSRVYDFSGRINGTRAEIKCEDETSRQLDGTMIFKNDKIGVRFDKEPFFKTKREVLFNRVNIQARTASFQAILGYIGLPRDEIFKKLGNDYKIFPYGAEGTQDGYFYPKLGVVIVFENRKTRDRIAWIECQEAVDINGVKAGSAFDEIRSKLGNTPLIETWEGRPDHKVYRLRYFVPHAEIRFQSESKNGDFSKVVILRK